MLWATGIGSTAQASPGSAEHAKGARYAGVCTTQQHFPVRSKYSCSMHFRRAAPRPPRPLQSLELALVEVGAERLLLVVHSCCPEHSAVRDHPGLVHRVSSRGQVALVVLGEARHGSSRSCASTGCQSLPRPACPCRPAACCPRQVPGAFSRIAWPRSAGRSALLLPAVPMLCWICQYRL